MYAKLKGFRLHARRVFDGIRYRENRVLTLEQGKIIAIDGETAAADAFADGLLVPGFVDLQVNGGGGVLFNHQPDVAALRSMASAHARFGTTAMLPTLITDKLAIMQRAADAVAQALKEKVPGIIGIHFEGPHLSEGKKGAHSGQFIREISDGEWQLYARKDLGLMMITLAPETVAAKDIRRLVELGVKVCLGHSNADYLKAQQAVDAGADGFTHLFNAMSPLQGREPGMVGCALMNDDASCGLIVDGFHVDKISCQLALKTKPKGKVFLVTDAMPPVGTQQTEFAFFDRKVTLNQGKLTSTTGELAGSVLDMATAVRNTHYLLGLELEEAIAMASRYPADYLGRAGLGMIRPGADANLVLLDENLTVSGTWIRGQQVFKC
ncbi:N-acetylglucosamine-6-phosphate deacetylase [Thalassomonas actiniarum]|uniref:N-acetylgalactosamine-6-phosphate deacetylase n=1 Tax=Thalassomonas actiniarum TaxID=485447 RepID=A0AAE9YQR9_9GAMM|nr:N-acetylglucosamine-6-phosphate deacetylase [Thalassomonas actiniarum]WDD98668.1 N-acetylglucosamine-6-phosphate deacetylase [Thalassomonas actiniarum]